MGRIAEKEYTADDNRFRFLFFLVIISFLVVVARLGYLQIVQSEKYSALAENQRTATANLLPRRGTISVSEFWNNDTFSVALTCEEYHVFAVPKEIQDSDAVIEDLVGSIWDYEQREYERKQVLLIETGQMSEKEIKEEREARESLSEEEWELREENEKMKITNDLRKRFSNPHALYAPLLSGERRFDEEGVKRIREFEHEGIYIRPEPRRCYPEGTLAAHVIGFIRTEGVRVTGEYGIEGAANDLLQGSAGVVRSERDASGRWISFGNFEFEPSYDGANIDLTIDRIIQRHAERVAREGKERYRADRATVIVMDPHTGAVTAMAQYPTFDPNYYRAISDVEVFRNASVSDTFEPGSIFKPIVMGIAMELGLVDPDTTVVDSGPLRIGGFTINTYDRQHHGRITMTNILEHSNNIGMVKVAQMIGAEDLFAGIRRFGIGNKTGIMLDGEVAPPMVSPTEWEQTRLANVGFGQGLVMTPIQVLTASAALINGGKLFEPYVIRAIHYPDGNTEERVPRVIRQVISPSNSTKMKAMLASVIENGVAPAAKVDGYYVGGKTGTAQVVDPETGRYSHKDKIISFIGFAPVDDPKFITLIVLDNPEGLSFAAGTAAPMFRDLAESLLDYYRVPPSR